MMQITYLIGNGFDLNLGLKTKYCHFLAKYTDIPSDNQYLSDFRRRIKSENAFWSDAELATGEDTANFTANEADAFTDCQTDLCEHLVAYLKDECARIDFSIVEECVVQDFSGLYKPHVLFPDGEKNEIQAIYDSRRAETRIVNIISFNYSDTIDRCVELVNKEPGRWGSHTYNARRINNVFGTLLHVHGDMSGRIVFGVNDESQIANKSLLESSDLTRDLLIKERTNYVYRNTNTENGKTIIRNSNIICIYGMSLGATDNLWWNEIVEWLEESDQRHLIIFDYDYPDASPMPSRELRYVEGLKYDLLGRFKENDEITDTLKGRIHVITGEKLFQSLHNIVDRPI